jgi:hypothetical protein
MHRLDYGIGKQKTPHSNSDRRPSLVDRRSRGRRGKRNDAILPLGAAYWTRLVERMLA